MSDLEPKRPRYWNAITHRTGNYWNWWRTLCGSWLAGVGIFALYWVAVWVGTDGPVVTEAPEKWQASLWCLAVLFTLVAYFSMVPDDDDDGMTW
jgi:hypothetical protein